MCVGLLLTVLVASTVAMTETYVRHRDKNEVTKKQSLINRMIGEQGIVKLIYYNYYKYASSICFKTCMVNIYSVPDVL